jgi:hypothetical protein
MGGTCATNLDLAMFEHDEHVEKRSSFDCFMPRVTGTTGRVFLLVLHPISSKSDGYGPTLKCVLILKYFSLNTNMCLKTQNLSYPFTIYPFNDVPKVIY